MSCFVQTLPLQYLSRRITDIRTPYLHESFSYLLTSYSPFVALYDAYISIVLLFTDRIYQFTYTTFNVLIIPALASNCHEPAARAQYTHPYMDISSVDATVCCTPTRALVLDFVLVVVLVAQDVLFILLLI